MKKAFIFGFLLVLISVISGAVLNNWKLTEQISGSIGLICFCTAGILSGAFISGDRSRANHASQNETARIEKKKIFKYLFAIGLPNIIVAAIMMLILK